MITVHTLEANLKVLPGKTILLHTESLTHSLPLPAGQQRSLLQREGRQGMLLTCHTQSVLSTAGGWAPNLSGRDGFRGWQDRCALLGKAPAHAECWHPGRHSSLESPGVEPALHLRSPQHTRRRSFVPSPPTVNDKNCFGYCPPKSWEWRKLS